MIALAQIAIGLAHAIGLMMPLAMIDAIGLMQPSMDARHTIRPTALATTSLATTSWRTCLRKQRIESCGCADCELSKDSDGVMVLMQPMADFLFFCSLHPVG